ncbi:hypothetical protein E3N88_15937 [Mikania micrantha]|uniref:PB1 domain-containing protein n=1 Tax=Mikania micrantha TaxID=192012 RepID=A0A5N6NY76_9ASTR|nr:hypothetical protein E3N88_15937 [Mikania micrantha]
MEFGEELLLMNSGCSKSPDPSKSGGSQTDPILSDLLDRSSTPLKYEKGYFFPSFVFWSENEGSENNSSSANQLNTIQGKIKSVFSDIVESFKLCIGEFWAPVTVNERRVLSTSGQPFMISRLTKELVMYRLHSEKHRYNIDVNKPEIEGEGDPNINIRSGGPATTFLRRLSNVDELPESDSCFDLEIYTTLPICFPSNQSDCVGVLGLISNFEDDLSWSLLVTRALKALKKVELDICNVQQHIPYEAINDLRETKDKITHALEIVCKSHKLDIGQVWCTFEDKSHVPLSTYLEDTQRIFGLKLTNYHRCIDYYLDGFEDLSNFNRTYDVLPLKRTSKKYVLRTIQDFKPRHIPCLTNLDLPPEYESYGAFVICLRSLETGDFNYSFEFIWSNDLENPCDIFLEAILLTIKRCLPSFKFASGAEIGDELDVINVEASEGQTSEIDVISFKIFQENANALEEGKQPSVVKNMTCKTTSEVLPSERLDVIHVESPNQVESSNFKIFQGQRLSPIWKASEEGKKPMVKCTTAEIFLTRGEIEEQFGQTIKVAAKNLGVSESTLKRKLKDHNMQWPPAKPVKKNQKDLTINKVKINEVYNGAIRESPTININEHTLTIKAEYVDDMIKIRLPVMQAKFVTIQKEIVTRFNLCPGTYKIKYRDEVGDWILLTSDEDLSYCIESSRKCEPNEIRLRVLPSTQQCPQPISASEDGQTISFKIFQENANASEEGKQPTLVKNMTCKTTSEVLPSEQLDVIHVETPNQAESSNFKKFQGQRLASDEGKKPMKKYKTVEIYLTPGEIQEQFGQTIKVAAKNLEGKQNPICYTCSSSPSVVVRLSSGRWWYSEATDEHGTSDRMSDDNS